MKSKSSLGLGGASARSLIWSGISDGGAWPVLRGSGIVLIPDQAQWSSPLDGDRPRNAAFSTFGR